MPEMKACLMETKRIFRRLAPVCAVFAILRQSAALADSPGADGEELEPMPLPKLEWKLPPCATLEGNILTVEVGADAKGETRAWADIDLSDCREGFVATIRARGENISRPSAPWLGLKFMVNYRDPALDTECWPGCEGGIIGTFDERTLTISDTFPGRTRSNARLCLGLQDSTGKVVFDLSSLRFFKSSPQFSMVNQDWNVEYPQSVSSRGPLRGVMSPVNPTEKDFEDLRKWGARLVRYQMVRSTYGWNEARHLDFVSYREWLDGRLDLLDKILIWAEKYDMFVAVDLHYAPGGAETRGLRICYRKDCLDEFLATWRTIATRFKGRSRIYGYDLVNEPWHRRDAAWDYLEIQRQAAEAVREIDPDVTIIVESNGMDIPVTFAYLSPLAMHNVIYEVHFYNPGAFTFQGVWGRGRSTAYASYPNPVNGWNRDYLINELKPVADFARRHGAKIYVGEFSAAAWLPGAGRWIADSIDVFEELGWDWTYHAFRESPVWDIEKTGSCQSDMVQATADTDRKKALLDGFAR